MGNSSRTMPLSSREIHHLPSAVGKHPGWPLTGGPWGWCRPSQHGVSDSPAVIVAAVGLGLGISANRPRLDIAAGQLHGLSLGPQGQVGYHVTGILRRQLTVALDVGQPGRLNMSRCWPYQRQHLGGPALQHAGRGKVRNLGETVHLAGFCSKSWFTHS